MTRLITFYPSEAQESKHLVVCEEVAGSSPVRRTILSLHSGTHAG